MLTYYNMQFAGTHPVFPLFSEKDLLGKSVTLQF